MNKFPKFSEILPNVYCIKFNNGRQLGLSFVRFQEHYEGPAYKGKIFTLDEYKKWYCANLGNGHFDYCKMYVGFNLPDIAFKAFKQGKFNPLTKNELMILELVEDLPKPFCLIGVNTKSKHYMASFKHEIAHGLWYTNKQYRKEMKKLMAKIPKVSLTKMYIELQMVGYHKDMYADEIQAYMSDDEAPRFFYDVDPKLFKKFQEVFQKYRR